MPTPTAGPGAGRGSDLVEVVLARTCRGAVVAMVATGEDVELTIRWAVIAVATGDEGLELGDLPGSGKSAGAGGA